MQRDRGEKSFMLGRTWKRSRVRGFSFLLPLPTPCHPLPVPSWSNCWLAPPWSLGQAFPQRRCLAAAELLTLLTGGT